MSTITLPNIRVGSDLQIRVRLKDGGVAIDWSTLSNIKACIYSDAQRALAGRCAFSIDEEDSTLLVCTYAANKPQYLGVNRIVISAKYMGETKTYDKPAFSFVRWTADQEGEEITIDDPDVDVEIEVEDVSSSLLDQAIAAALAAAAAAEHAAHLIPNQVLLDAEAATVAANAAADAANAAGITSAQVSIADDEPGTPSAEVSLANKVLSIIFHHLKGNTGDAAGFGTITATVDDVVGDPSVTVTVSGPDTAKNFTFAFHGLRGIQGVPGVANAKYKSVDTLPTASAATMDFIYLTPSGTTGVYNMSYTEQDGSTYSWQDLGTTAIQLSDYATKAEVSQLEAKLYGNNDVLLNDITTAPSTVYITSDMVSPGDVLVFELESLNNLQGVLKAEKTGYVHDQYISVAAGQTATVSYTVPQDFLRIYTTSSSNPMKVTCQFSNKGDIDDIKEKLEDIDPDAPVTTEKIEDGAVTSAKMASGSVTSEKIAASSIERGKLSADVKGAFDSPFTLDGNVVGNYKCIPRLMVYVTNREDANNVYKIGRIKRVNNAVYITLTSGGTNVCNIDISSFTPTTTISKFTVGKADHSIIAEITIDWSVAVEGTDITPNWQIKAENVVFVHDMNHIFIRTASTVPSFVSESFKSLDITVLNESDVTSSYYLYSFIKNNGTFMSRVYKGTASKLIEASYTTGNEVLDVEIMNIKAKIDLSLIPEGTSITSFALAYIVKRGNVERNEATDGYLMKDTILNIWEDVFYVDCNRTANSGQWFKSIAEACEHIRAISPSKHQKQYEVVVMPGVYHEAGILLPPYTHVHGTSRDSVIVTDTDYNGEDSSCLFDFGTAGNVPWQSTGRYAKISNLTLRETQGRYCIHASQPYMCGLLENVTFEHHLCTTGDRANNDMVIGVGCGYSGNLFTFDGCSFKSFGHKGKVTGHTVQLTVYGNCRLNFKNCVFVNSDIYWLSIGSCGNLIINVEGCSFLGGSELIAGFTANAIQPYAYQSDLYEINFIGGHNKHLIANLPCSGSAVCVELDTATEGDVIYLSGSIADALFGGVQYKIGGNSVKAKATGTLYVADAKNASNQDVFQMWKRLGDCSLVPKTMTVNINGTTQTVTLNDNYTSSKPAESTIIATINAQLTGCTFKKVAITDRYSKLNMAEKELIFCGQDVAKFACVDKDGVICPENASEVYGIVLEETAKDDIAPVWTGFGLYTGMANGSYAVGENGVLVASANNVVYNCTNGVLTRA